MRLPGGPAVGQREGTGDPCEGLLWSWSVTEESEGGRCLARSISGSSSPAEQSLLQAGRGCCLQLSSLPTLTGSLGNPPPIHTKPGTPL